MDEVTIKQFSPRLTCSTNHKEQELPQRDIKRRQIGFSNLSICHKKQPLNWKITGFNQAILKAAKETTPLGARKKCRPHCTEESLQLEDETAEAWENAEINPTVENNMTLKAATSKTQKDLFNEVRRCWREKTEQPNLDEDGSKA